MNARRFLIVLFLFSGIVLMASPDQPSYPADWVERMVVNQSSTWVGAINALTDPARPGDWVDRMIAAARRATSPSPDWIDRLVADRGLDSPSRSRVQNEELKAAFARVGASKE